MNRERITNLIGFCLLAAAFLYSAARVVPRMWHGDQRPSGERVLRFAHWQLERGIRGAFDELAREFERRNPGVRVEQIAIPERSYSSWLRTQLVGGTAPDLIQIGNGRGDDPETMARYFQPLTAWVTQPNPANAGTDLAGVLWRDTFADGLVQGSVNFNAGLQEFMAIPASSFNYRVVYNKTLWREALGDTPSPKTFTEFLTLGQRMQEWGASRGVVPIAGSLGHATQLFQRSFQQQTQLLGPRLDESRSLLPTLRTMLGPFFRGEWDANSPEVERAFSMVAALGRLQQPGFEQATRDDATLRFTQEKAFMLLTGSWDLPSLTATVEFPMGVFPLPAPRAGEKGWGDFMNGPISETLAGGLSFALTRNSPDPDLAIAFLQFITSREGAEIFSRQSKWLSPVVDTPLPPDLIAFEPDPTGLPPGVNFTDYGADVFRLVSTNTYRLFDPRQGIQAFLRAIGPQHGAAMLSDTRRNVNSVLGTIRRADSAIGGNGWLSAKSADALQKARVLAETQALDELFMYELQRDMHDYEARLQAAPNPH